MKPSEFYGMALDDREYAQRDERFHKRLFWAAFVSIFIAGFVLGLMTSSWNDPVLPRWIGW